MKEVARLMRRGWCAAWLLCALGLAQAQHQASRWPARPPLPALDVIDLTGKIWDRESLRGKTVVVNFWATWCAPCLEELPSLQTFHEFHQASDVVVLAVNVRDPLTRLRQFVARNHFGFPVVADRLGGLARQWGVKVFPTSIIFSPGGEPIWVIEGGVDWSSRRVEEWISAAR